MNTYASVHDYLRATSGQETASLTTNVSKLSSSVIVGATSLPVTPNTTSLVNVGDRITIFDGGSSEVVTVTTQTAANASSIPVSATQFAHASLTSLCGDGLFGSLADAITSASSEIERFCEQSLFQQTYTNETLRLRSMSSTVNRDYSLTFRPRHFPITSLTGLALVTDVTDTITLDASQAILDATSQVVVVPLVTQLGSSNQPVIVKSPLDQTQEGWLKITYQAGYTTTTMPYDVKQACQWLTSDVLSDRLNATGASELVQGKRRAQYGKQTRLVEKAYYRLEPYRRKSY